MKTINFIILIAVFVALFFLVDFVKLSFQESGFYLYSACFMSGITTALAAFNCYKTDESENIFKALIVTGFGISAISAAMIFLSLIFLSIRG